MTNKCIDMKKKVLLFGLAMALAVGGMKAQNTTKSVVFLKNGSVIKCDILEWQNDTIKFQTSDGSLFVYSMHEVDKISNTSVLGESKYDSIAVIRNRDINNNIMERDGEFLSIGHKRLSDIELSKFIDNDDFLTYKSAQSQISSGGIILGLGIGTIVGCLIGDAIVIAAYDDIEDWSFTYLCAAIADICIPIGCILRGVGKGRISWIADKYNNKRQTAVSFSPTVLGFNDILTDNKTYAVGATLSINF